MKYHWILVQVPVSQFFDLGIPVEAIPFMLIPFLLRRVGGGGGQHCFLAGHQILGWSLRCYAYINWPLIYCRPGGIHSAIDQCDRLDLVIDKGLGIQHNARRSHDLRANSRHINCRGRRHYCWQGITPVPILDNSTLFGFFFFLASTVLCHLIQN